MEQADVVETTQELLSESLRLLCRVHQLQCARVVDAHGRTLASSGGTPEPSTASVEFPIAGTDNAHLSVALPSGRQLNEELTQLMTDTAQQLSTRLELASVIHSQRRQGALLRAIVGVQAAFVSSSAGPEAFREMLGHLKDLTGAGSVLIAEVVGDGGPDSTLKTLALHNIAWNDDMRAAYEATGGFGLVLPVGDSLLGQVVTSRNPVISDRPFEEGLGDRRPEGHPPIDNYLGIPAFQGDTIVGILALINRAEPFTDADVRFLEPLVMTLGQLIKARRANEERNEERQELRVMSEIARQMPVGAVLTTREGHIQWSNPALFEMTGYTFADLQGRRPFEALVSPDVDQNVVQVINSAMAVGKGFRIELPCLDARGDEFWAEVSAHALQGSDPESGEYVTIVVNIDERRRTQQLELERDLAEARTEGQREFLAHMSHELRTPLNAVLGFQHLLGQTELSVRQQHLLGRSAEAAKLLLANISDVLDFSKMDAGALELESVSTDVTALLDEVCSVAKVLAEQKGVDVSCRQAEDLPSRIASDPTRLRQLLVNLLGNAVKFTDEGGVTLVASHFLLEDGRPGIRFSVSDTGIGIDDDRLAVIFEPFQQADTSTSRRFGGTGLGLAICQKIVAAMGGHITATSTVGVGTTFTVDIPVNEAAVPAASEHPATVSQEELRLDGLRLLVAEDNDFNGELVVDLLEGAGAVVDLVKDGQQAVQRLRDGSFDVVLLDVQMPVMDGLTAARVMTQTGLADGIPLVALTANAQAEDRQHCLDAGMCGVIVKPVDPPLMMRTLREVLESYAPSTTPG